jgi:hypothetical protein
MSYEEFTKWQVYFNLRPVEWRDDNRIMKIMQCLGVKESADKIFESIALMKQGDKERHQRNEMVASLRNSAVLQHLLGAVGGDKLDLLEQL